MPQTLVRYTPTLVLHTVAREIHDAAKSTGIADLTVMECTNWVPWKCRAPFAALVRPDGVVGYFERNPTPVSVKAGIKTALGFPVA